MEEATGYRDLDRLTAGHGSPPRTSVVRALPASGLHPITSRPACLSRPTPQPGGCYLLVAPRLCIVLRPARPAPAIGAGRGRALCPPARDGSAWMHHATFDLVWLGVLILTRSVGVPAGPVCPAFPLRFRLGLSAGGRVRPVGVV